MSEIFKVISPIDGSIYCARPIAEALQIETVLRQAKAAQALWQDIPISQRKEVCSRAVAYLVEHADTIGRELTHQMGRPIRYTPSEIRSGMQERATYMMDIAEQALADIRIPEKACFTRFIKRVPLGTVLVLAPWNYPFLTSINAIIPALMAGNTVILKHAQQTLLCAERYQEAFDMAGLPSGVFQYLHMSHRQVGQVIQSPSIDYVAFTGSVKGGAAVQEAVKKKFINVGLELGGKDPAYVRADADLPHAIENLVDGAFFNSGQSCCGVERIYVQQTCFEDFVQGFVEKTYDYNLGNPLEDATTLGPMVRADAAAEVRRQVQAAIAQGAKAHIDVSRFIMDQEGSAYVAPQVLTGVHHGMELMIEETFGPVVGIMPVSSDREALQLMNDSRYGLTASIWTKEVDEAINIGDALQTGTVYMNRCDYLDPALAWTGVKDSGRGCTLSAVGYEVLTRPKSYHLRTRIG